MAFVDKKNDDLGNEDELDPIDEILKRINERSIDFPPKEDQEPVPETKEEKLPKDSPEGGAGETAPEETVIEEPAEEEDDTEVEDSDEANDSGESEEADEDEIPDSEPVEETERCIRCGKRRRDLSVSPDYEYCKKCREEMRYAPLSWKGIVCVLCIIIITGMAVIVASMSASIALPVMEAKDYEKQNRLTDAQDKYTAAQKAADDANTNFQYKNPLYTIGTKTFAANLVITAKIQSPLEAGHTLSSSPVKDAVNYKSLWLKDLKQYSDMYAKFDTTQKAVEPIVSPYKDTKADKIPYDKIITQLSALQNGENANKYQGYIIEYYKAMVASMADKGAETELGFILQVKKLAPAETWLYNPYLASCYQRMEKYADVVTVCNAMIAYNANDIQAYSMKARALCANKDTKGAIALLGQLDENNAASGAVYALKVEIYRRSGDIATAFKLCQEAVKASMESTEFYRQQAIVYLLKNDKQAAYEAAQNVYNSLQYNQETPTLEQINTIALCASLAKEKDMYKQIVQSLESNGYKLADSVDKCIKGKMTVQEIFVTGKGDVL